MSNNTAHFVRGGSEYYLPPPLSARWLRFRRKQSQPSFSFYRRFLTAIKAANIPTPLMNNVIGGRRHASSSSGLPKNARQVKQFFCKNYFPKKLLLHSCRRQAFFLCLPRALILRLTLASRVRRLKFFKSILNTKNLIFVLYLWCSFIRFFMPDA